MANETSPVEGPYNIHDYTVSESVTIEQGTMCKLSDARTAAANDGAADPFAGIMSSEFVGGKSKVKAGLWTTGTHVMTAVAIIGSEGAIVAGSLVVMSGPNLIRKAIAAELLTGAVVGKATEAIAAATTGEVTLRGFGG